MANTVKRNVAVAARGVGGAASFQAAVQQALGHAAEIKRILNQLGLATMTTEQRLHSTGKFRSDESGAISAILDVVDARPGLFESLAAHDHGKDDTVVETEPSRTALARRDTLAPLLQSLEEAAQLISDDVLTSGELVKDVSVPAYAIIKASATVDAGLRSKASTALNFYNAPARTRAANKRKAAKQGAPK